jgi:hypothetical protein
MRPAWRVPWLLSVGQLTVERCHSGCLGPHCPDPGTAAPAGCPRRLLEMQSLHSTPRPAVSKSAFSQNPCSFWCTLKFETVLRQRKLWQSSGILKHNLDLFLWSMLNKQESLSTSCSLRLRKKDTLSLFLLSQ